MNFDIREMVIDDYDEAFALWLQSDGIRLAADDCESRRGIERFLERNPGMSFVARDGGRLIGAVLCGHDGRRASLNHLTIAEEYRRRGVASALVQRCLTAVKNIGINKCNLFVVVDNKLYPSLYSPLIRINNRR